MTTASSNEERLQTALWEEESDPRGVPPRPAADGTDGAPRSTSLGERYEDLGRIGRGGMGDVRRVRDLAMGRVLAMKLLPREMLSSPRDVARFLAEARTTAALQHPGIIPVHDAGELADGRPWFTMKEVRGRTLGDVLTELHRARFDPATYAPSLRRVLDAYLRVCEAVAYAHSLGVVHRDLKPDNIMIGEFGEVLVMDWGLARCMGEGPDSPHRRAPASSPGVQIGSERTLPAQPPGLPSGAANPLLTEPGEIMGTLTYMPPEQARAEQSRLGPPTDVYALGAVLYELLAGRRPYTGSTSSVWAQLIKGPPQPVETIAGPLAPLDLCAICARAMARDPEARFADAGALAAEVRAWLDGARRRERALAIVADARAMKPRIEALRAEAKGLREQARALLGRLRSYDPVEQRTEGWRIEDEAARIEREVSLEEVAWMQTLRSALHELPELSEAHDDLAQHYHALLIAAEEARDASSAGYEALLRLHDRGRFAAVLSGDGALTLVTDPEGAEVSLYRYVERGRRLVPEHVKELGRTPIRGMTLQRGSYLLKLRAPDCEETLYPVHIARGEHWDGVRPGGKEPCPVWLPRVGELTPGSIYVPAGWFLSGGDPEAVESLPRRRLWVDSLVVQRFPVTNAEYLEFLNALVASGREAEALTACPRVPLGNAGPGKDALGYARDPEGRFCLAPAEASDKDALRWPAAYLDWQGAMRYARWLAGSTGEPWRLLNELEWEKAARGVDGRLTPWGDHVEANWTRILGSHPGVPGRAPVEHYPTDVSPYGVRGMAGNVRDRCINVWKLDGPAVEDGVVQLDAAGDDDPDLRASRGGAWISNAYQCHVASRFAGAPGVHFGGMGFRVARPLR